jgi:hypothetical protein
MLRLRGDYFFFAFAQRTFCAATILARPSGLIVRRVFGFGPGGRPRFNGAVCPVRRSLVFCRRSISASISATKVAVSIREL